MVLSVKPKGVIDRLASAMLPTFVKRVVFLGTLFCSVEAVRGVVNPRLQALNEELKLVSDTEVLRRVAAFTDSIWKTCPIDETSGITASCEAAVISSPVWLRYANSTEMANDVARLIMARLA